MRYEPFAERRATPGLTSRALAHVQAWAEIGEAATLPTQHPDFGQAAAQALLPSTPLILVEQSGPAGCEAMAPLVRDRGRLARWRLLGDREVHEPGAPLVRDAEAAARLAEALCALERPVELARVPLDSPIVAALREAAPACGTLIVREADPCPFLALDAGWSEAESQFSSRRRSDFRRAQRKAEALGEVSYAMHRPTPVEFDGLFAEAIAVEAKSWKRAAGTAILCDPEKERFFRSYLRACAERGETRVAAMRIDGTMVAMQLAVAWRGRYWLYKIGFDEDVAKCSPGTLLMLHALGEAAREGLTGFEMMGETDSWISDFWTREAHPCVRLRFYPRTLAGFAGLVQDGIGWTRAKVFQGRRPHQS
ncbi:GNAT family N-acetyltransferase [Qipengyuania sp. YG27]|uniref:GNAT family N-acetyltransferase n=1 Tax=Qipengyuania mesophila TaxID=2867246 RepID=A0ABS7JUH3_9SPHN|nr:GNAT family N-acetyltransferase [Qipengyuania mesophila]MBX7501307.1 GNAT family N-acetyltransferase [Qipengyuania mesophila]